MNCSLHRNKCFASRTDN